MTTGKKLKKALKEEFSLAKQRVRLRTGKILAILRQRNELTQNQLAQKPGLTQATNSCLESNRIDLPHLGVLMGGSATISNTIQMIDELRFIRCL